MSYLNSDSPKVNKQKDLIIQDQEMLAKLKEINKLNKRLEEANYFIRILITDFENSVNYENENEITEALNNWKSEKNNIMDNLNRLIK